MVLWRKEESVFSIINDFGGATEVGGEDGFVVGHFVGECVGKAEVFFCPIISQDRDRWRWRRGRYLAL